LSPGITDADRRDQLRIRTDKHIIADDRFMLICAIIVTGDRQRTGAKSRAAGPQTGLAATGEEKVVIRLSPGERSPTPLPTLTGATSCVSEPTNTSSPMIVLCLFAPS
jgi:hypothetical protein